MSLVRIELDDFVGTVTLDHDRKRNALVYLTYSDRLIEGSPQNSVTAVPVDAGNPIPLK